MALKAASFLLIAFLLIGCKEDIETAPTGSLASYFQQTNLAIDNDLIACAANNLNTISTGIEDSVAIFFLPREEVTQFRYFETEHAELDPHDHKFYQEKELSDSPVFGGHLRKFTREATATNHWCIVTFENSDTLFYSNPILLKSPDLNTEINPDLLSIDQSEPLSPKFNWQDGSINENVIYFQVISDAQDNLISGTYTVSPNFQFYDLSNVVLNINDVTPAPTLMENERYFFTMMAVSIDNWVNLVIRVPFETGP